MRHSLPTLAAVLLGVSLQASAQQQLQPTPEQQQALQARWKALDLDHDGYLNRSEVADTPALSGRFEQLDGNRDFKLSQDELLRSTPDRLRAADTNQDGAIDRAEAQASLPRVAKAFDRLDKDGDGKLTAEEMQQLASRFAGRRQR